MALSGAKKRNLDNKYEPNLFLKGYGYSSSSEKSTAKQKLINNKESTDREKSTDVRPMPPLEGDE